MISIYPNMNKPNEKLLFVILLIHENIYNKSVILSCRALLIKQQ